MTDSGVVVPPFRHHRFLGLACGIRIAGQPFKTARFKLEPLLSLLASALIRAPSLLSAGGLQVEVIGNK